MGKHILLSLCEKFDHSFINEAILIMQNQMGGDSSEEFKIIDNPSGY